MTTFEPIAVLLVAVVFHQGNKLLNIERLCRKDAANTLRASFGRIVRILALRIPSLGDLLHAPIDERGVENHGIFAVGVAEPLANCALIGVSRGPVHHLVAAGRAGGSDSSAERHVGGGGVGGCGGGGEVAEVGGGRI